MLHNAWRDVRWPVPVCACVRVCERARTVVVVNARNIGIHCGGQEKPRTGSCVLELREKMPQLGLPARPVGYRAEGTARSGS